MPSPPGLDCFDLMERLFASGTDPTTLVERNLPYFPRFTSSSCHLDGIRMNMDGKELEELAIDFKNEDGPRCTMYLRYHKGSYYLDWVKEKID